MNVLAMIMAGGASKNLSVLTEVRCESAVPFAGKFRVIDFILSNCTNSGIYNIAVLTQYLPRSLNEHIGVGKPWDLDRSHGGVRLLQPYLGPNITGWERGTADAVRRNLDYLNEYRADTVLILGGNHVYKMDYRSMLKYHQDTDADVTVGIRSVNPFETHRFGIITTDANQRIMTFEEKPKRARDNIASMGVYIFKASVLKDHLLNNATHDDFGRDILPAIITDKRVFGYKYEGFWANVGTLQAYWEANMALLTETPALDLYDPNWVIHTRSEEQPCVKIGHQASIGNNLMSNGCIVDGGVEGSVISPGVYVAEGATVIDSVLMNDAKIGAGSVLNKVILDKDVTIGENVHIGGPSEGLRPNQQAPEKLNTGLSIVGKGSHIPANTTIGHNVIIAPNTDLAQLNQNKIEHGATVKSN